MAGSFPLAPHIRLKDIVKHLYRQKYADGLLIIALNAMTFFPVAQATLGPRMGRGSMHCSRTLLTVSNFMIKKETKQQNSDLWLSWQPAQLLLRHHHNHAG
jgi:hypothetical protein